MRRSASSISTAARSPSPPTLFTNSTRTAKTCGWCATPTMPNGCAPVPERAGVPGKVDRSSPARRDHPVPGSARHRLHPVGRGRPATRGRPLRPARHLAFNAPLRTRRERAQRLKSERKDFFDQYGPEARQILEVLEKYADDGNAQIVLPDVLHVPPLSGHGTVREISAAFGGPDKLRQAVTDLQNLLYAA